LESARAKAARTIILKVAEDSVTERNLKLLNEIIASNPGNTSMLFELTTNDGIVVRLRPHNFMRLNLSPEVIERIEQISDSWRVEW
jgi:cell division septal protein FtsQ